MKHLNYNFNVNSRSGIVYTVSPILKKITNDDGSISVVEDNKFSNPYAGLNADSFSLESQINAGVRLNPSPKDSSISIGRVDSVVSSVNNVIAANKSGVKLNSKNKK